MDEKSKDQYRSIMSYSENSLHHNFTFFTQRLNLLKYTQ